MPTPKPPVLLSRWYEFAKWLLERVENFPKSQRFVLGQRLVDGAMDVLELLVEAAYSAGEAKLNRKRSTGPHYADRA